MSRFAADESRIRSTSFSPCSVGSVDTRKSIARSFDSTSFIRPSCGTRFSEMSSFEITFRREAIFSRSTSGGWVISRRSPSMRKRMR